MKQHEQYSDNELRKVALIVLTEHLGHANTLRFLSLHQSDKVDYLSLRNQLFEGMTAREIYDNAAEFWNNAKSSWNVDKKVEKSNDS
jgi:hypothetical protein